MITDKLVIFKQNLQKLSTELLLSEQLLREIFSTALRPKFHSSISDQDIDLLRTLFVTSGILIDVREDVHVCRDPKDNFLLSLAKSGDAHYLITGDKDLLVLNKIGDTNIITYSNWIALNDK